MAKNVDTGVMMRSGYIQINNNVVSYRASLVLNDMNTEDVRLSIRIAKNTTLLQCGIKDTIIKFYNRVFIITNKKIYVPEELSGTSDWYKVTINDKDRYFGTCVTNTFVYNSETSLFDQDASETFDECIDKYDETLNTIFNNSKPLVEKEKYIILKYPLDDDKVFVIINEKIQKRYTIDFKKYEILEIGSDVYFKSDSDIIEIKGVPISDEVSLFITEAYKSTIVKFKNDNSAVMVAKHDDTGESYSRRVNIHKLIINEESIVPHSITDLYDILSIPSYIRAISSMEDLILHLIIVLQSDVNVGDTFKIRRTVSKSLERLIQYTNNELTHVAKARYIMTNLKTTSFTLSVLLSAIKDMRNIKDEDLERMAILINIENACEVLIRLLESLEKKVSSNESSYEIKETNMTYGKGE